MRRALQRAGGALRLVEVKTAKSRRTIPLPLVAVRALQQHRQRQAREGELAGDLWTETGWCSPARPARREGAGGARISKV